MCSIVTFLGHLQQLAIDYTLPVLFISGEKCVSREFMFTLTLV